MQQFPYDLWMDLALFRRIFTYQKSTKVIEKQKSWLMPHEGEMWIKIYSFNKLLPHPSYLHEFGQNVVPYNFFLVPVNLFHTLFLPIGSQTLCMAMVPKAADKLGRPKYMAFRYCFPTGIFPFTPTCISFVIITQVVEYNGVNIQ